LFVQQIFLVEHFATTFSDLYTEGNFEQVMDRLDARMDNKLRGDFDHPSPLFSAVVPVRVYRDSEISDAKMPVPMGVAIDPRADGHILMMGGVCERHYGLQIFLFP
jgi:hypothetical protein